MLKEIRKFSGYLLFFEFLYFLVLFTSTIEILGGHRDTRYIKINEHIFISSVVLILISFVSFISLRVLLTNEKYESDKELFNYIFFLSVVSLAVSIFLIFISFR